jgi:hypothetical protein
MIVWGDQNLVRVRRILTYDKNPRFLRVRKMYLAQKSRVRRRDEYA